MKLTQIYQWQRMLFDIRKAAFAKPCRKAKTDDCLAVCSEVR
ncbi:hypothetical protein [Stieleria varia]|nr:hypothetical protein [Stieleria varia]